MRVACANAARDPNTLSVTVCVTLAYPELSDRTPQNALRGTPEQIANALAGYADLGVAEVIVDVNPYTPEALSPFGEATALYRDRVRAA